MTQADGFVYFKDRAGEYRWALWRKGRSIAVSGEGYKRIEKARSAVRSIRKFAPVALVVPRTLEGALLNQVLNS